MFRASGSSSSGVQFFTVQAASGILCNLLLYSTRSPTCSVPEQIPLIVTKFRIVTEQPLGSGTTFDLLNALLNVVAIVN